MAKKKLKKPDTDQQDFALSSLDTDTNSKAPDKPIERFVLDPDAANLSIGLASVEPDPCVASCLANLDSYEEHQRNSHAHTHRDAETHTQEDAQPKNQDKQTTRQTIGARMRAARRAAEERINETTSYADYQKESINKDDTGAEPKDATPSTTTQAPQQPDQQGMGDVPASPAPVDPPSPDPPARVETPAQAERRWRREGKDLEVAVYRGRIRDECKDKGMSKREAFDFAWTAALAAFPPPGVPPVEGSFPNLENSDISGTKGLTANSQPIVPIVGDTGRVQGLGDIPGYWPEMPSNASLQAELGWVQSERLRIVEEVASGATHVHLERAREPAPSWAALGWLETSIRSYAKYIDIMAKSLSTQADEETHVRRERMAIEDIRELLRQMREE